MKDRCKQGLVKVRGSRELTKVMLSYRGRRRTPHEHVGYDTEH